jgi:hypothetical protein
MICPIIFGSRAKCLIKENYVQLKNPYLSQFTAFPSYEFWVRMTVVKLAGARAVLLKGKKH